MAATVQQQHHHHHHIKALTPTWLLVKVSTAPAPPNAKKQPAAACSPILLSPSAWRKAWDDRKSERGDGGTPESPRIGCMGQVKGRGRTRGWCSNAPARGSGHGGALAALVLGLFGRRRRRRDGRASRACSKVRDVPRGSSRSSVSAPGRSRGGDGGVAAAALDPPLPVVVRRPASGSDAPSLWERRRGGGKVLEGLRLPQIAAETESS